MGLMDELGKVVDNVKDGLSEATHKSAADGEQAKRDIAGDALTPGEKLGSIANQAKESVLGNVDAAKQDVRNNT